MIRHYLYGSCKKVYSMKAIVKYVVSGILFSGILSSCADNLDFNQYDQLEVAPTFEASILYVEVAESIVNEVAAAEFFSKDFNFDAFSSDIFAKRVIDGEVTYVVENTTSKEIVVTVEFLDVDGTVLDTEELRVQEAPTSILQRDIAYGSTGRSIETIKNLSSIRVSAVNQGDTTSISNLESPMITLKSSGKFRVRIK